MAVTISYVRDNRAGPRDACPIVCDACVISYPSSFLHVGDDVFFSSRRRHTRCLSDWSSDVCSSELFDLKLAIESTAQVVNVDDEANTTAVDTDPTSNGGALVLRQKELQALSDDPDELSQQLQAMAGPGAGP